MPGKKHPVLVQEYLGTIYTVRGFIPKRSQGGLLLNPAALVEYGLSAFILRQFELLRPVVSCRELLC